MMCKVLAQAYSFASDWHAYSSVNDNEQLCCRCNVGKIGVVA